MPLTGWLKSAGLVLRIRYLNFSPPTKFDGTLKDNDPGEVVMVVEESTIVGDTKLPLASDNSRINEFPAVNNEIELILKFTSYLKNPEEAHAAV